MNQSQAKEWLPLIQALAEGKTIQFLLPSSGWTDCDGVFAQVHYSRRASCYRIKPEPKKGWYRVALFKDANSVNDFYTFTADSEAQEVETENDDIQSMDFVRWLTDRIEYELPEGEA